MGIFFLKNGCKDVTDIHLLLFGGTDMVNGSLDHSLETDGLLEDIFIAFGNTFHSLAKK